MHGRGVKLTDLVDFKRLQLLQDNFSQSTGFTSIILDENGNAITRISSPNPFSQLVESVEHADAGCLCFTSLGGIRSKTDEPLTYTCPYSGFTTVYVPVLHEGCHIASWGILQARVGDPGDMQVRKTAGDFEVPEEEVRKAICATPTFSEDQIGRAVATLQALIRGLIKTHADKKNAEEVAETNGSPAQVQRGKRLLNRFLTLNDTGMLVTGYADGEILECNSFYATWLGLSKDEVLGKTLDALAGHDFDTCVNFCTTDNMLEEDGAPVEPYQWNDYSALHGAWLRCTNQLIYWHDGRLAHLITFRDITDERRMQDELSRLAYYDRQMNLPNALKLSTDLDMVSLRGNTGEEYLVCFDITSLRRLNDAHGRKAGDAFLRTVTKWIEHQGLPGSVLYRIEGDEFCLRLSGVTTAQAIDAAQRVFNRFGDLWSLVVNGQQISVICSVAISVIGIDSLDEGDELLNIIQRTLDISRKDKKVVVYDEETDQELKQHIQTQLSLKKCVKQRMKGFGVYFQPIVDPPTGTWKGLEALCRWTSPEIGAVPPGVFIREAEQLGLINLIGEWVLETSVRLCKNWGLDNLDDFFLSVNLSPVQIMSTSLIKSTLDVLQRYNYPGNKLSLEVTESTRLNFDNHTLGVIEKLRGFGIMIALDDFGTGYSSFNNMKNLPVRFVKTDHSFIRGIEQDYFMQYFYHIITELAHKTGMKLVVEGVETVEQLEIMMKNGVDYIQGYYFGRPMPPDEVERQLDSFRTLNPPQVAGRFEADAPVSGALGGKESYLITTNTFNAQTRCMQILLSESDSERAFNEVLELLGTHYNTRHAYLYRRVPGSLLYRNAYEWSASGVKPHKLAMKELDTRSLYSGWMHHLRAKGMIVAGDTAKLHRSVAKFLKEQDVLAIAALPIRDPDSGEMIGFIGLDDNKYRNWLPEEIIILKNIGLMVASLLKQQGLAQSAAQSPVELALEHMDLPVFVSELGSDRILWSNARMRALCGEDTLAGKPCYAVMRGCDNRCAHCHAKLLLNDPARASVHHEYYDVETDRTWMVYNTLIPWQGGVRAQLEYSVDITDIKKAQRQMEYLASTDALSGAMNRGSLMQALPGVLRKAHRMEQVVSIAFVDIDKLKHANDVFGHTLGDLVINKTSQVLRGVMAEEDLVGRIGGDEFVLVLHGKKADEAVRLLTEARMRLRTEGLEDDTNIDPSFSFGVVENTEIPYKPGGDYIRGLFDIADGRMREFKQASTPDGKVRSSQFSRLFDEAGPTPT